MFGCKNPAPKCSQFCTYKITLLNNDYNKKEFGYKGFSKVCGTYSEPLSFELWATITKDGHKQDLMLFNASNITLNQQGKTNNI